LAFQAPVAGPGRHSHLSGKVTGRTGSGCPESPCWLSPCSSECWREPDCPNGPPAPAVTAASPGSPLQGGVLCVTTQPVHGSQVYEFTAESFRRPFQGQLTEMPVAASPGHPPRHLPRNEPADGPGDLLRTVDLSSGKVNVLARTAFARPPATNRSPSRGSPSNYYLKRTRYTVDTHGKPSAAPWAASPALNDRARDEHPRRTLIRRRSRGRAWPG